MSHKNETHLDDGALLMFLDGEDGPEAAMHISQCPDCSQRAEELRSLQDSLTGRLFFAACPTSMELGEYQLRMVGRDRAAQIERHLAACEFCAEEINQLQEFMNQPDPYLKPDPLASIERRVRVLVARLAGGPGQRGGFGAPALAPALAGLRGQDLGPRVYEAGDIQVIIEVEDDVAEPGRKMVLGLLSNVSDATGFSAGLWLGGRQLSLIPVDPLGNFVIENLSAGHYELILAGPEIELHIQDVTVE